MQVNAYPIYQRLTADVRTAQLASFAKRSTVQKEIDYFRSKAATVKTPEDFLKDRRLLSFALSAYGLESQLDYPARIKQILLSDRDDSRSLVNRMTNPQYRQINIAFDFKKEGVKKLSDKTFIDDVVSRYTRSEYEQNLGETNPALADALYFERAIKSVTSGYNIIGDPIMFDVVKTAFNIPSSVAGSGKIEGLKKLIEKEIPMDKVKDEAFIKKIVNRFLVLRDVESQRSGNSNALLDILA